jgi:hypothetical protein
MSRSSGQCGWLKDRFGVSWQVVARVLMEMLQDSDRERSRRVMAAMPRMRKIDVSALKAAYGDRRIGVGMLPQRIGLPTRVHSWSDRAFIAP